MKPRDILLNKARKYRESIERESNSVTLMRSEFNHLMRMLEDCADELESYESSEEFSHAIRGTIKKIKEGAK